MRNYSPRELREMPVSEFLALGRTIHEEAAVRLQGATSPPNLELPERGSLRGRFDSSFDLLAYESGGFAADE